MPVPPGHGPTPGAEALPAPPGPAGQTKVLAAVLGIIVVILVGVLIAKQNQAPQVTYTNQSIPSTTDGANSGATGVDSGGVDDGSSSSGMSDTESYDALMSAYNRALEVGDEVGKARKDGKYGGTGFAYDVFNRKIGDSDRGVRQDLVDECSALLETARSARAEAESLDVSDAYQQDKQEVVGLYGLLVKRTEILLGAAEIALDSPDESSWRPVLTPASTDARIAYQDAIEGARPDEQ